MLEQLRTDEGNEIPDGCEAVLLKALIANSASLENVINALKAIGLSDQDALKLALLTTGYGGFDDQRLLAARITALS